MVGPMMDPAAVTAQAAKLPHTSNLFYAEPAALLASELCRRAGMAAVFFGNSGAEANEGMIKLARKSSFDRFGADRHTIVTLNRSFHGRTVTTLAATGQDVFHNYFFPFTQGFRYAEPNDLSSVIAACGGDACAVMLELLREKLPMDVTFAFTAQEEVGTRGAFGAALAEAMKRK